MQEKQHYLEIWDKIICGRC